MEKEKSLKILDKCLKELENMTPEDVASREIELGMDPSFFEKNVSISAEDAAMIIQQKFTSHNKHAIDRITITEEEYFGFVGSKCIPEQYPKRLIITIEQLSKWLKP